MVTKEDHYLLRSNRSMSFFAMEASNANIGLVSSFNFVDLDLTHCLYNQV